MMRLIPTLKCKDMKVSLDFYTDVLGFDIDFTDYEPDGHSHFASIKKENCEIHLSTHSGDGTLGSVVYFEVDEVDNLFTEFLKRGMDNSHKSESPVHQGPTDQSWGMREFYVDDPSGNTLRFGCLIK